MIREGTATLIWWTSNEFTLQFDNKCTTGLEPLDHMAWEKKKRKKPCYD